MNNKELIETEIKGIVEEIHKLSIEIYKENDIAKAYKLHQLSHKLKKLIK